MKKILFTTLLLGAGSAHAAGPSLVERAVTCQLKDAELAGLMSNLKAGTPGFAKAAAEGAAPSYSLYKLPAAVAMNAYRGKEVVVMPATIMLAVDGKSVADAVKALKLEPSEFAPASRTVRPTVEIVAMQLSSFPNKVLVGCRYSNSAAAGWVGGFQL